MSGMPHDSDSTASAAVNGRLAEAVHLQAIEDHPLTADETAMFEMFEREGWPPERRRAHIARGGGIFPAVGAGRVRWRARARYPRAGCRGP